jgi:hypothetical protein
MDSINKLIENLNKEQKEAVLSTEGPNLIVAGAGSGKTRVLTTRLAHIKFGPSVLNTASFCSLFKFSINLFIESIIILNIYILFN